MAVVDEKAFTVRYLHSSGAIVDDLSGIVGDGFSDREWQLATIVVGTIYQTASFESAQELTLGYRHHRVRLSESLLRITEHSPSEYDLRLGLGPKSYRLLVQEDHSIPGIFSSAQILRRHA